MDEIQKRRIQVLLKQTAINFLFPRPVLLSQFFKRDVNKDMEQVTVLLKEKKFSEARNILYDMIPYFNEEEEKKAYRLIGLSYYKNEEFSKSVPWFEKICKNSNNPGDWFNLASSQAQSKLIKEAEESFLKVEEGHKQTGFQTKPSFYYHLYWFVIALINVGEYDKIDPYYHRLYLAYERVRFTEPNYLESIGLPKFEDFLQITIMISNEKNQWKEKLLKIDFDEHGKKCLKVLEDHKLENKN